MAVAPAEETEVNNRQDTGGLIPTTTNNQTVVTIEDIQDYLRRNKEIVENEGPYSSKSRTFIKCNAIA
ncbi:hypothetical protein CEXT_59831 [Caerostris extrusa]|uniref:Uncharacterized protein n=1 Tax=Caerostris extrusa TaxID=172846 RepID=A0AAV4XW02_CAEEX|nr:hypothetical protein CEXT_59831 [Caerostris extrusa]